MSCRNEKVIQYGRRAIKERRQLETVEEHRNKRRKLIDDEEEQEEQPKPQSNIGWASLRSMGELHPASSCPGQQEIVGLDDYTVTEQYIRTRSNSPVAERSHSAEDLDASRPSVCKPKDLSDVFTPLPQLLPPAIRTPRKSLTKQMLIRSRTEPSLLSTPSSSPSSRSRISVSQSLPFLDVNQDKSNLEKHNTPPPTSLSASPAPFRTYSQSRSFILALPAAAVPPSLAWQRSNGSKDVRQSAIDEIRESYTDLRTRWGVDSPEDDPTQSPGLTNDLLSITELRSKGESRRFLDEVSYLFEGLQDPDLAISVRRSSAAEIVTKMCDPEFFRRAKAADFISRAWDTLRSAGAGDGDKLLDIYLLFFVALISRDKRDIDDLAQREDFYNTLIRLMRQAESEDGLSMSGSVGLKSDKAALSRVKSTFISKSNTLAEYSVPSMRLLASYALSRVSPPAYPPQLISAVLDSLVEICSTISLVGNSPTAIRTSAPTDMEHLSHCLHILDAFFLGLGSRSCNSYDLITRKGTICSSLTSISILPRIFEENSVHYNSACHCMEMALRILIALSHMGIEWCEILAVDNPLLSFLVRQISQTSIRKVKSEVSEDSSSIGETTVVGLDHRSLSLALLSNIVLSVKSSKDYLRTISMNPSCSLKPSCPNICQCPQQVNAIEYLSNVFGEFQYKTESSDVEELEFFHSHLAALLCLLAAGSFDNENTVRNSLAKVYNAAEVFSHSVQSFLEFYNAAQDPTGEAIQKDSHRQIEEACIRICS